MITRAAELLRAGGVVVYPTETVYGIGCDPFDETACSRILALKNRPEEKTMLLVASCREQVEEFTGALDSLASSFADRFWPGSLTLVIRPLKELPTHILGPSGGVAVRVTSGKTASALAREFGRPIISTSANLTGMAPVLTFEEASALFGELADLVIPSLGPLSGSPSTIVDLTGECLLVLREGEISLSRLQEVM